MVPKMASCGNDARLLALLEGTLPASDTGPLEAHLEVCEWCRKTFDTLAAGTPFWTEMRRLAGLEVNPNATGCDRHFVRIQQGTG